MKPQQIKPLTRAQVREVDRRAIEDYGINSLVLMENAGRGCVDVMQLLGIGGPVVIVCGKGNNGGDGFVIARRLQILGFEARVVLIGDSEDLRGDARSNFQIAQRCDLSIQVITTTQDPTAQGGEELAYVLKKSLAGADWIVDALLGTGAKGELRTPLGQVIEILNAAPARRLAVDLPSGLDCDTGAVASSAFRADHTCTFVAIKPGFLVGDATDYLGEIHLVDIGAPPKIVEEVLGDCKG